MQKQLEDIIKGMDVNRDREDAESRAMEICRLGDEVLPILIELGRSPHRNKLDGKHHRKYMRALIFTLSVFARKNKEVISKSEDLTPLLMLLSDLADKGFLSASAALKQLGFSETDVLKKKLLSLPLRERHSHDKETSLPEAIEEIRLSAPLPGFKGLSDDHYAIGEDKKHQFDIYRIGKTLFGIRSGKKKKHLD